MAAQPFDKDTLDKVAEAFKNLNTETKKTLSEFENTAAAEQKMLDIARQLGQEFKTRKDELKDELKGKNLQEQLQLKLKNSETELANLSQARINSQSKINSLQDELKKHQEDLINEFQKGEKKDQSKIDNLNEIIRSKVDESLLEKNLLKTSADRLTTLKNEASNERSLLNILESKAKLVALIAGTEFIKDLNLPKSIKELLERTYALFKLIDKSATDLRKTFGLFREDAAVVEKNIREIVIELGEFGIKADDVQKSMSAVGKNFNYINALDKSIVKDIAMMSKQMGISEEKSAKFLKTIGGIKGESGVANKSMLSFAGSVATAYGIGLDEVMTDVADAGDDVRAYAGKTAEQLIIGAAQARQMGTTLDNMAKTSKGLLNFETSIQAELKASALIGKNINFNEARRLAFQGKTVEANKLILDQAKKIKFNQLNPLAQEAFAAAAGKSVKELQDMLESENRMKSALTSNNKEVREAAKAQIEKQNLLKSNSKLAQQEYEKNLLNKANQERIVILQNRLNAALQKIMLPVLEALTDAMEDLVKMTEGLDFQKLIKNLYAANVLLRNTVSSGFVNIINKVKSVLTFPGKVVKALSDSIGNLSTKTANFLMNKFTAIKNAVNLVKGYLIYLQELIKGNILNIGKYFQKILTEIKLLKIPLVDDLLKIANKIKNIFSGLKSSQLTTFIKNIIDGFKSAFSAIKASFQPVINIVKDLITKLKNFNLSKFLGLGELAKTFGPLGKFLSFLGKFASKIPGIGNFITAVQFLYEAIKNISEVLSNPNLTGLEKIGGIFKALGKAAYTTLIEPFLDIGEWIGEKLFGPIYDVILDVAEAGYNIGVRIWDGIKSVFNSIVDTIGNAFSKSWDKIKDWLGFSPSVLGLSIVKGIVSIGGALIDAITSPFEKAFEIVKMGLELIWEKMKGIGSFISETIGKTFSFVGRIVGVTEEPAAKTAGETKTNVKTDDLLITAIVNSNKAVLEKLDKLTNLMSSGQIAVYIDGQRANQLLATSNAKFGSFGQATTN